MNQPEITMEPATHTCFSSLEIRETEGTVGDQKFVYGDDFRFRRVICDLIFHDGFQSLPMAAGERGRRKMAAAS